MTGATVAEDFDNRSPACFVCEKHRLGGAADGGILYEDDLVYAGHVQGRTTAYRGWLTVEPKRHAPGLGDLTDDEACALGRLVNRLAGVLKHVTNAEHVYAFVFGDGVPHLHVHLVPRYPNTPHEYWGARLGEWPEAPRVGEPEMRILVTRLGEHLGQG
jgi:diadenosine tetraphosphate (Ap4A) HIT family hydrolase